MSNPYLEEVKKIREAITIFAKNQSDETLVDNQSAFPFWSGNGLQVKTGEIYRYEDSIYRVMTDHTTQSDWTPDVVPALYNKITATEWEKWESGNFYKKGAKVIHNNKKWVSNVDNNHWEPGATGVYTWDEVTES